MGDKLMNYPNDDRQNYSLGKSIIYSSMSHPFLIYTDNGKIRAI